MCIVLNERGGAQAANLKVCYRFRISVTSPVSRFGTRLRACGARATTPSLQFRHLHRRQCARGAASKDSRKTPAGIGRIHMRCHGQEGSSLGSAFSGSGHVHLTLVPSHKGHIQIASYGVQVGVSQWPRLPSALMTTGTAKPRRHPRYVHCVNSLAQEDSLHRQAALTCLPGQASSLHRQARADSTCKQAPAG